MGHATFEDKRRENFEKGQAELERRRQIILEQQRREQQERERKEREEMQRREKVCRALIKKLNYQRVLRINTQKQPYWHLCYDNKSRVSGFKKAWYQITDGN